MTNELAALIEKLRAKQGETSDAKFAAERGLSRQGWVNIYSGKHNPGSKFFGAILNHDSDLTLEAISAQKSLHRS